jgi:ATP-dependent Lon protease
MAAYKNQIKTIIIPNANRGDLYEVEEVVKENVNFVFAEKLSDVLDVALCNQTAIAD